MNFKISSLRRAFGVAASVALLSGLAASAQPFTSPVGPWDAVESGPRDGVARMTFNDDGTISMGEIIVPKTHGSSGAAADASRGTGGDDGRNGSPPGSGGLPAHTNLYGLFGFPSSEVNFTNADGSAFWAHSGQAAGRWGFDGSGRLVGFFAEITAPSVAITNIIPIGTNVVNGTNITLLLTNVEYRRLTNSVSFSGKVSVNNTDPTKSRLTLLASTPEGKVTFSALPPITLPDLSGGWFGQKRQAGLPYNEFFTNSNPDFSFTSYDSDGAGAEYITSGTLLVVRQKKFGIVLRVIQPHDPPLPPEQDVFVLRAVTGSVDFRHGKISGRGLEGSDFLPDSITYKALLVAPTPAN